MQNLKEINVMTDDHLFLVSSFGQTYSRNEIPTKHYAVDSVEEMKMIFPHQDEEEVVRPQEEEALPPEEEGKAFPPEEASPPPPPPPGGGG